MPASTDLRRRLRLAVTGFGLLTMLALVCLVATLGTVVMHGAGWLEGGLVASFEKFVLDCDLIQMVMEFLQPLETTQDALGVEAIREVGPGGLRRVVGGAGFRSGLAAIGGRGSRRRSSPAAGNQQQRCRHEPEISRSHRWHLAQTGDGD